MTETRALATPGGARPSVPAPGSDRAFEADAEADSDSDSDPDADADRQLQRAVATLAAHPGLVLWRAVEPLEDVITVAMLDGVSTLCVTAESRAWQRCLEGRWATGGRLWTEDSGRDETCLVSSVSGRRQAWAFTGAAGPVRRGCETQRVAAASGPIPKTVDAPIDLAALGTVSAMPLGPGSAVLRQRTNGWETAVDRVCWRSPAGLVCGPAGEHDMELLVAVEYGGLQVASAAGSVWVAVQRSRESIGGTEEHTGDERLLVYRLGDGALRLHGHFPLGGHADERFGESFDEGFIWTSTTVHSTVTLGPGGCLTVKTTGNRSVLPPRGAKRGKAKTKRLRGLGRPGPHVTGADGDVYGFDLEVDRTGAWMPSPSGGFDRVPACRSS